MATKKAEAAETASTEEVERKLKSFGDITVYVTATHDDGTLDLQEQIEDKESESGYKNGRWFQNIAPDQVTALKSPGADAK